MPQVSLSQQFSLHEIEESLRELAAFPGGDLTVTRDYASKRHGALRDAARLQLLATWARGSRGRRLTFDANNSVDAVLEQWCDYAPGLVALRMSGGIAVGDQIIERRLALLPATKKIEHTDSLELGRIVKGRGLDFPILSGAKRQYLRALFTARHSDSVKGMQAMSEVLQGIGDYVLKADMRRVDPEFWGACGLFASELLKNTQEHATSDALGMPYMEHAEGLIVAWNSMSAEMFRSEFNGHSQLEKFWDREEVELGRGEAGLRTLELSFFDTGPGFLGRLAGDGHGALTIEEERRIVMEGLRKHATSKRETGAGNGIPDVLEKLRQIGGLITIRTGRLRIFRAFAPGEQGDLFAFQDWSAMPLAAAVGAVVSIIVPIRRS